MSALNYERDLNAEQRAAVLAPDGPVLVIAAAGTGKTRTLTYRVAHLVERGVPPDRILLLTFTNRAAREMLERAERLVGQHVSGLWGGTFHHMANRMLRRDADRLGLSRDYVILDEDDAQRLLREVLRERRHSTRGFPSPEVLLSILSWAVSRDLPLGDVVGERLAETGVSADEVLGVFDAYAERKRKVNALDFDDLLVRARQLLVECEPVRTYYQRKFLHVLVDEYQDTNVVQAELVELLAAGHGNLLVVGDDFQSIYSWRGADYRHFLDFPRRHPGVRIYKLETNYRSLPGILRVANVCIAGNPHQFQKVLRSSRPEGPLPKLVRLRDGLDQAAFVADEIGRLCQMGMEPAEIAVLYRAHYQALELQLLLTQRGVAFDITSGIRFFEQAHVKDVLALLRLAYNPGDVLAFERWITLLPGVGERGATRLWEKMNRRFNPLAAGEREFLGGQLPAASREAWAALAAELNAVGEPPPAEMAARLIQAFLDGFYREHVRLTYEDAERRLDDLQALSDFAGGYRSLGEFLNEVVLLTNVDTRGEHGGRRAFNPHRVLLSTVHQAKGLEWRVVFVLWLAEGLFPTVRALEEDPDAEEERRLFYVAVTRARDRLYLCVPRLRMAKSGDIQPLTPSRFVEEIPPGLLEIEDLVSKRSRRLPEPRWESWSSRAPSGNSGRRSH